MVCYFSRNIVCFCLVLWVSCNFVSCAQDSVLNNVNEVEISSSSSAKPNVTKTTKLALVCPSKQTRVPFFSPNCKSAKDCSFLGQNLVCCKSRCIRGVVPPKPEPRHTPILGVVDRVCPINPMPEFLPVQECTTDADCGPRICCPETAIPGGSGKGYCRNPAPRLTRAPAVRQFLLPLKPFASYLQCTAPPPPFLDIFPRPCESPFDCFPNLCCQENGKKFCRPPQKSLFTLIAGAAQRVGTSELAKNFIQRIS